MAALSAVLAAELPLPLAPEVEALEIDLLLEALLQRYGFDLREYERSGLRRKLHGVMRRRGLATVSALQERVLHEASASAELLRALSPAPASMFDRPQPLRQLRQVLASCLRASAVPKIWLAECAGAEEAWTLAILLAEENLCQRTEIFATIASGQLLAQAIAASFPAERLAAYQANYRRAGGGADFDAYFEIAGGQARLRADLRARITWAQYNLVTDASFNEFQLIVCQRALPDFGPALRQRVLTLFHDSLAHFGLLGLDRPFAPDDALAPCYQQLFAHTPWYKRVA